MDHKDLIQRLENTLYCFRQGFYMDNRKKVKLQPLKQLMEAKVILPHTPLNLDWVGVHFASAIKGKCEISCVSQDSFQAAEALNSSRLKSSNEILVLNFANPVNPGGGVRHGARAQEEDLCRRSSLLFSLEGEQAQSYYDYNRRLDFARGSDALILSPCVEIIKNEEGELLKEPFCVSVLTCAAPYIAKGFNGMSQSEYFNLLYQRIVRMLQAAASGNYRRLVLGAWGCGAFGNDASVIAVLFEKALKEFKMPNPKQNHSGAFTADQLFDEIVFAVPKGKNQYNYDQFASRFFSGKHEKPKVYKYDSNTMIRNLLGYQDESGLKETENFIAGCLVGGAAGDALGYAVEFLREPEIFSQYGPEGIQEYQIDPVSKKALISDDTQMTLFTARGLLDGFIQTGGNPEADLIGAVQQSYQNWLDTQRMSFSRWKTNLKNTSNTSKLMQHPELFAARAPGITCLNALEYQRSHPVQISDFLEYKMNKSKGCGGVMRTAPSALLNRKSDISFVGMESAQLAAITHSHPLGWLPSALLGNILYTIVYDRQSKSLAQIIKEACRHVKKQFASWPDVNILTSLTEKAIELAQSQKPVLDCIHELGEGWVGEETLAIAVFCALRFEQDFSACLLAAVNHNGDSDSTGAVAGNLLGAWIGLKAIPEKWKQNLELYDVLLDTAKELAEPMHNRMSAEGHHAYENQADPAAGHPSAAIVLNTDDITKVSDVQAIVTPTDSNLGSAGAINHAVHKAAGKQLDYACAQLRHCDPGKAVVTPGFNLPVQWILHTATPNWIDGSHGELDLQKSCYYSFMELAAGLGIRSIAIPAIGSGLSGFPKKLAARNAATMILVWLKNNPGKMDRIQFCIMDPESFACYQEAFDELS